MKKFVIWLSLVDREVGSLYDWTVGCRGRLGPLKYFIYFVLKSDRRPEVL